MSIPYFEAGDYLKHKKPAGLLLDVRSPSEYTSGHFPGAINLPLLQDEERKEVGIAYKHKGYEAAFDLGLSFVGPKMTGFVQFVRRYKSPLPITLYCWRGGKRSASMAWLLQNAGLEVQVISGGYKSLRKQLLLEVEKERILHLVSGYTGSGKTELLHRLKAKEEQVVDLEGLAKHKGSAFGGLGMPKQPSQEQFENLLGYSLYGLDPHKPLWVEHESRMIGRLCIPDGFYRQFEKANIFLVEVPILKRIESLVEGYANVDKALLEEAIKKIERKMGPQYCKMALEALQLDQFDQVAALTLRYYDRCYEFDLEKGGSKNIRKINCSGNMDQAVEEMMNTNMLKKIHE